MVLRSPVLGFAIDRAKPEIYAAAMNAAIARLADPLLSLAEYECSLEAYATD